MGTREREEEKENWLCMLAQAKPPKSFGQSGGNEPSVVLLSTQGLIVGH